MDMGWLKIEIGPPELWFCFWFPCRYQPNTIHVGGGSPGVSALFGDGVTPILRYVEGGGALPMFLIESLALDMLEVIGS